MEREENWDGLIMYRKYGYFLVAKKRNLDLEMGSEYQLYS